MNYFLYLINLISINFNLIQLKVSSKLREIFLSLDLLDVCSCKLSITLWVFAFSFELSCFCKSHVFLLWMPTFFKCDLTFLRELFVPTSFKDSVLLLFLMFLIWVMLQNWHFLTLHQVVMELRVAQQRPQKQ